MKHKILISGEYKGQPFEIKFDIEGSGEGNIIAGFTCMAHAFKQYIDKIDKSERCHG